MTGIREGELTELYITQFGVALHIRRKRISREGELVGCRRCVKDGVSGRAISPFSWPCCRLRGIQPGRFMLQSSNLVQRICRLAGNVERWNGTPLDEGYPGGGSCFRPTRIEPVFSSVLYIHRRGGTRRGRSGR